MSCCQAARLVPRDFFGHDEGIDGVVSSTLKMEVFAPIRYGVRFFSVFSCHGQVFDFSVSLRTLHCDAFLVSGITVSKKKDAAESGPYLPGCFRYSLHVPLVLRLKGPRRELLLVRTFPLLHGACLSKAACEIDVVVTRLLIASTSALSMER